MRRHALELLCQQLRLLGRIADAVDHCVLKRHTPSGRLIVVLAGRKQRLDIPAAVDGHDLVPALVVWGMEGDGKRDLQLLFRKQPDLIDKAAGGEADVAHTDVHAVGAVDKLEKANDIVEVIQRLADAHQNDVRDLHPGIKLRKKHLIEQLRRREPPHKAAQRGGAELAAHRTADLGGDADGVSVVILHENGLHTVAVAELPEVLDRAVLL